METALETIEKGDLKACVYYDNDGDNNPRDWDNLGVIVGFHRDFGLQEVKGEVFRTPEDFHAWWGAEHRGGVCLRVYAYIHSGITIKTGESNPFSCDWDSCQVGYVFITGDRIRKEFGVKRITEKTRERARRALVSEVETLDCYLRGEVYCYTVEDQDGDILESCGGYVGDREQCKADAVDIMECRGNDLAMKNNAQLCLAGV